MWDLGFYEKAFVNCQNLENLSVNKNFDEPLPKTINAVRKILETNKKLKTLETTCWSLFNDDFSSEVSFELKELSIINVFSDSQRLGQNFNLFLKAQRDTLEKLTISELIGVETIKIILSMPRLKEFTLSELDINPLEDTPARLPQSHSITSLALPTFNNSNAFNKIFLKSFPKVEYLSISNMPCDELADLIPKAFKFLKTVKLIEFFMPESSPLRAFVNVEILEIEDLTDEAADSIPEAFVSLKTLKVDFFDATNISNMNFYLNLEEFSCESVNQNSFELFKAFEGKNLNKDWKTVEVIYMESETSIAETVFVVIFHVLELLALLYFFYYLFYMDMYWYLKDFLHEIEEDWNEGWIANSTFNEDTFTNGDPSALNIAYHFMAVICMLYMAFSNYVWMRELISDSDLSLHSFREIVSEFDFTYTSLCDIISELFRQYRPMY